MFFFIKKINYFEHGKNKYLKISKDKICADEQLN